MSLGALLDELKSRGVHLEAAGESLRVSAPRGAVTAELRRALAEHKGELLVRLRQGPERTAASLGRIPRDGPLPLSFAQERLWFLDRLGTGGVPYNIPLAFRVSGPLEAEALQRSLRLLCRRHEVLRGACRERDGRAEIHLVDEVDVPLPVEDRPGISSEDLSAFLTEETRRPFDLAEAPMLRARLLRLAPDEHVALLVTHHFVADGWSMRILVREVLAIYQALARGRDPSLPPLPVQYVDFAAWQRRAVERDELEADRAYWRRRLVPPPPPLELPFARPRPEARSGRGGTCPVRFDRELSQEVAALARERRCTPFMALATAFATLLTRCAGGREVAIATAVSGRPRLELEPLVGCFVNNLVLRCDLSGDPPFAEVMERVREVTVEAFAHQELPFEKLVEELNPQRDLGRTPLFQAMLVLENAPLGELDLGGLSLMPIPVDPGTSRFDLTLSLADEEAGLAGSLEYDADLYAEADVRRLGSCLATLLEGVVEDPHRRLSRLPLLPAEERRRVVHLWNVTATDYAPPPTLHGLVKAQIQRSPDAVAVAFEGNTLSYRELERRADQLARRLVRLGVGPETVVGVAMERSLELVVALLAVLEAGAAYLPLDPDYPEERLAAMLEDSGAKVVLTQVGLGKAPATASGVQVLETAGGWEEVASEPAKPPEVPAEPLGCAYVIYTSGSTGRPKGVMVPHAAIVNRLLWMQEAFAIGPGDRVAQKTPFSFDVSVWELFWPLTVGARLEMAPPGIHRDAAALGGWLEATGTTVVHFVPSMLRTFLDHGNVGRCGSLRLVVASGEALTADLVERFRDRMAAELHNLYGPTEAAVDVTHWPCDERPDADPVPIGRPIANLRILILDEALEPTPVRIPGELCIGGVGLARGYLGRPGLTADRFVPDPVSEEPGARLYRTGDLARWRDDGTVEFLGRRDHQVKVRGFRVELGEIEAVLDEHPEVSQAVVTAPEIAGDRRLAAYVVPAPGSRPSATALRRHLAARLPSHMVPGPILVLDELPSTTSGKVDRRALPEPGTAIDGMADEGLSRPRTTTEEILAGSWAELLGVEDVPAGADFFALGGHSLLATRLVARIRETFGVELPLQAVFEAPRLADLAREIDSREGGEELPSLEPLTPRDELPLSAIQERLWFLDRFTPGSAALNMPIAMRLRGSLDANALKAALQRVVARHEALRVIFGERDGRPVQRCHESLTIPLPVTDLTDLPAAEVEAARARHLEEAASSPFDLATGPLVAGRLLRFTDEEHLLLLAVHHIVADGWSLGLVVEDLAECYRAHLAGREPELPVLPVQHADFAAWQKRRLESGDLEGSVRYWTTALDGAPEQLELPTDRRRPALQTFRGRRVARSLPRDSRDALRQLARDEGATPFMALLAAFAVVLHRWSGQAEVVVGAPVAGRTHRELDRVVGPFLNTVALRLDLSGSPSFRRLLGRTRDVVLGALQHAELPFERVLDAIQPPREPSRTPIFQVFFNMLNFPIPRLELPGLELEVEEQPPPPSKFDLTAYVSDEQDSTRLEVVYNADLFEDERIEEMVEQLTRVVEQAVADPERAISTHSLVTPRARRRLPDPTVRLDAAWPGSVHELFARQVARRPRACAIEDPGGAYTYEQTAAAAGALAAALAQRGVGPGDTVAVYAHRSAALAWSVLGVLQRGAAVALLDPVYPERRLARYVEIAEPRALLRLEAAGPLPTALEERLAALGALVIDVPEAPAASGAEEPPEVETGPDDPACIAFTSGSTGEPKAVVGCYRSLTHFLPWQQERFGLSEEDRYSVLSGLSHDPLQRDLFTPLTTGATVCFPDPDAMGTPGGLADWAARSRVTVAHLTPAMARLLSELPEPRTAAVPTLRWAFLVGEALTRATVRRLREIAPAVRCVNLYGATETQRAVAWELVEETDSPAAGEGGTLKETVPLGRGAPDVQLLVLGPDDRLAGVGEVGEIHVRSPHLARGYLGPEELTTERFRPNPFGGEAGDRLYRTGDLGRYLPDGRVEWVGRADRQVGLRGFRIEPGEIEAVLGEHPDVAAAAVALDESLPPEPQLVAWVEPREGRRFQESDLRSFLAGRLPAHMVPARWVAVDRLPLTPNGKVDYRSLPEPPDPGGKERETIPPRDGVELRLVRIWEEVLGRGPVGVRDDFFALGGHSLLAVRLVARVESELGWHLPLTALFQDATVERLALRLRRRRQAGRSPLVPIDPRGDGRPPFLCVHPVGGTVLCYQGLSARLGEEQPFYGLEAAGVDGERPPLRRVEEMAVHYLAAVEGAGLEPPFVLGGWSFGGLVAFEMARRLRAEGGDVPLLVFLDTWPPGSLGALEEEAADDTTVLRLMARALGDVSGSRLDLALEELERLESRDEQLALVVEGAREVGALPPEVGVDQLRPLVGVVEANLEARREFVPAHYGGRILLLRATEPPAPPPPDDPTLGWARLAGDVAVEMVPGDHYTMLAEPNVEELAMRLAASIDRHARGATR